jgi:hypothetical protein
VDNCQVEGGGQWQRNCYSSREEEKKAVVSEDREGKP